MLRFVRRFSSVVRRNETSRVTIAKMDIAEGKEIEGFLVNKVSYVPEFNITMIRLRHVRTGCDYLHLARNDSNNVFSVGFRTTPTDSTGVAHILEHTTLCGSTKFPCRDPFFKMLNRSMATFMNALTGPDYTFYPFSTQNKIDYSNLMSVYLDAVFSPNLRDKDFQQEGWRLEHQDVNKKDSPIVFKGVVYNEMKGVFSENESVFSEALVNSILPSHTYGVVSGGDPKVIPKLNHADLVSFHKKYYHPSNCRMYSYGNFPLQETLNYVNKNYLADHPDPIDTSSSTKVPSEVRWETERRKHITYRPAPMSSNPAKQASIAVSTLCNDIKSPQDSFVMNVLAELLVRGPNSAFYKSLIEPNIAGGFHPVTGYDSQLRDTLFSVGLSEVDPTSFDQIIEIYHKTLDKVIDEGFDSNQIKGIIHSIELNTKHQTSDFGLNMLFAVMPIWNHDGDLEKFIKVNDKLMKFKKCLGDNSMFLQDVVLEVLKENQHRLILTADPDDQYERTEKDVENQLLEDMLEKLSVPQKEAIFTDGLALKKDQDQKQDISCLPTLAVSDLSKEIESVPLKGFSVEKVPTQFCLIPTNGITYFRGVINTSILSEEAKSLLPLFCTIVTRMGTTKHDYRQLDQMIQLKTGGLSMSTHLAENIYSVDSFEEGVVFSSFSLDRNIKPMTQLWTELFNDLSLKDAKRFETLVKTTAAGVVQGIADSGHLYAMSTASSLICPLAQRKEQLGGLTFVQTMRDLSARNNLSDALDMMNGIADVVLKKKFIRLAVNSGPENEEKILTCFSHFLQSIKGSFKEGFELTKSISSKVTSRGIHYELPYQVSYAAQCVPTVVYTHKDFPTIRVIARLLTHKYLLPNVREKGGAYGSGCTLSTSGLLSFYSYRDPNPVNTLDVFNRSGKWIAEGNFTERDIDEAKLGVFQSIDAPIPPGSKGVRNFLYGITDEQLQQHRQLIMSVKREDVMRAASYLNTSTVGRALLGPPNPAISSRPEEKWEKLIRQKH